MLIRKQNRVPHPDRLLQVLGLIRPEQHQVAFERDVAGIYVTEHACFGGVAQSFIARDIELRAQLLSLVAVKDAEGDGETDAERIYSERVIIG